MKRFLRLNIHKDALVVFALVMLAISQKSMARTVEVAQLKLGYRVAQHVGGDDGRALVLIAAGRAQGVVTGALFETFRKPSVANHASASHLLAVQTGKLKALEVHEEVTLAAVLEDGSPLSRRLLDRFSGIMVGDYAVELRPALVARQEIIPEITVSYDEIFVDPKAMPQTFELSANGRQVLDDIARRFGPKRLGKLFIEGHTDRSGPAGASRVESYQRALTVRQFLVSEYGFEPERAVALGFGHSELVDNDFVPGFRSAHRRIVFKAVSL